MSEQLLMAVLDRLQFPQGSAAGDPPPNRSEASRLGVPEPELNRKDLPVSGVRFAGKARDAAILVTGEIGAGKTSAVRGLAEALRRRGIGVDGIVAVRIQDRTGRRTVGYDLEVIGSGERISLASEEPPGQRVGRFYLREEALQQAGIVLKRAAMLQPVVILDEVGRLELSGRGHVGALESILVGYALPVLTVRLPFIEAIRNRFGLLTADCYHVREDRF